MRYNNPDSSNVVRFQSLLMRVFLTGTDGYIGVLMAASLQARGHTVTGLDTGFYRRGWLYGESQRSQTAIQEDIRRIKPEDLQGYDAVIHLAELSNDPLGQMNPQITYEINHRGSVALAEICKKQGIPRFIYASSCSIYGFNLHSGYLSESSALHPQTAYARSKMLVERDISQLADDAFSPTFMRNATAYGPSPRMRFDIVVNNLAGLAWTAKEIRLTSDGSPWRPLVHVQDICQAFAVVLEAPWETVHNQVFNVGSTQDNYQIRDIAEVVAARFPGCQISFGAPDADNRSYRVSFDKIKQDLPAFSPQWELPQGVEQLRDLFGRINLSSELFTASPYTRLKELKRLIDEQLVDESLFWR